MQWLWDLQRLWALTGALYVIMIQQLLNLHSAQSVSVCIWPDPISSLCWQVQTVLCLCVRVYVCVYVFLCVCVSVCVCLYVNMLVCLLLAACVPPRQCLDCPPAAHTGQRPPFPPSSKQTAHRRTDVWFLIMMQIRKLMTMTMMVVLLDLEKIKPFCQKFPKVAAFC